jgi:putative oxidoreductase
MNYFVLAGRILYSLIFLMTLMGHFNHETVVYAASKGVPGASFLVPVSGIIAALGAVSIILGYKTRAGALLIILFLIPVTVMMHAFWKETDPMQVQMQTTNFIKNLSLLGAAILIYYFGPGPMSIDHKVTLNEKASAGKLKY